MTISENLKNAVNDGDITAIRSCFYTIILSDPRFKTNKFDEALNFVKKSNVEGVFDLHNGEELLSEEEWDEAYFDMIASKMQDNFSEKRIEQLKKVSKKIYDLDRIGYSQNAHSNFYSSSNSGKEYNWLIIVGVAIAALWVLRLLVKRGK